MGAGCVTHLPVQNAPWVKGISEGDDYGFRTYVEPDVAPVPEPGSV